MLSAELSYVSVSMASISVSVSWSTRSASWISSLNTDVSISTSSMVLSSTMIVSSVLSSAAISFSSTATSSSSSLSPAPVSYPVSKETRSSSTMLEMGSTGSSFCCALPSSIVDVLLIATSSTLESFESTVSTASTTTSSSVEGSSEPLVSDSGKAIAGSTIASIVSSCWYSSLFSTSDVSVASPLPNSSSMTVSRISSLSSFSSASILLSSAET
mmetsp:Transcript_2838/g.4337  ORF Transcript_2838/g.4337 Transcript_2838/m.4337 type:complete len:215 (+) Transcript_2838:90-734(+)